MSKFGAGIWFCSSGHGSSFVPLFQDLVFRVSLGCRLSESKEEFNMHLILWVVIVCGMKVVVCLSR